MVWCGVVWGGVVPWSRMAVERVEWVEWVERVE